MKAITNAEAERLIILSEEMAECQKEISKILRFGFDSAHPEHPLIPNKQRLGEEIGDVLFWCDQIIGQRDIDPGDIAVGVKHKRQIAKHTVKYTDILPEEDE